MHTEIYEYQTSNAIWEMQEIKIVYNMICLKQSYHFDF